MHATKPTDPSYGYTAHLAGVPFDDARVRTVDALKNEGFGVLTEIDVKSTLKAKLDRDFRRYVILGACNPQLAHQALEAELGIGLLLPCNVCVWEEDGGSVVSIARPEAMFELVNRPDVQPIAQAADYMLVPSARLLVPLGRLRPAKAAPLSDAALTPYHAIKRAIHAETTEFPLSQAVDVYNN